MQEWIAERGLELVEHPVFRVTEKEGEETATIEFLNIQKELHNIHVSLEILEPKTAENQAVNIQLKMTDAANEKYFRLPERDILTSVPKSEYIRLHLSGETESALLIINARPGELIQVNDVSANVTVPMFLSLGRMLTIILLLLAGYFLRPSSELHKYLYLERTWKGNLLITAILALEIGAGWKVCQSNLQSLENTNLTYMQQYQMLAHSLAEGKTWLDIEPDDILETLSNPYDYRARSMALETEGGEILWDSAYYEGKYYVYFGIVPELLFFLPYYLITGQDLPTVPVVFVLGIVFAVGVFVLIGTFIKKWYPKTPLSIYILLSLLCVNGCGLWSYFRNPCFYEIPILSAMALGVWGIHFWLSSIQETRVSRLRMSMGSLLLALIAGCRPQLLLLLFLALPIYWKEVKNGRLLGERKISDALIFGLPIFLTALGIMYYNYIRFGSVTDFGASYNLTLQDMTHREISLGRTVFGFFTTFFQPPYITGVFPYFQQVRLESQYYGQVIQESGFGGLIATNLILTVSLFPGKFRHLTEEKSSCTIAGILLVFSGIIAFFDIQIGGMIPRYVTSFAWLLFLAAAILLLAGTACVHGTKFWRPSYTMGLLLFMQCMMFNFLTIFTDVYEKVKDVNPQWFYQVEHLIEFWL